MTLVAVYAPNQERLAWWVNHLGELLPEYQVVRADSVVGSSEVEYAVVWKPPAGTLAGWPNLKATISIGAGIDHVLADPLYPDDVPILKTIGPDMIQRMREFVTLQVLVAHREMPSFAAAQADREWRQIVTPIAQKRTVGILGMGLFGKACVAPLANLGFNVRGWSRRGTTVEGAISFKESELDEFLTGTEILVCLMPLTDQTKGILNSALFAKLPVGAHVINLGRGQHVVEPDLLAALEIGQVSHAALDVFDIEPLPAEHPYWTHPNISITPHIASMIDPVSGGREIARTIQRFDAISSYISRTAKG